MTVIITITDNTKCVRSCYCSLHASMEAGGLKKGRQTQGIGEIEHLLMRLINQKKVSG